FTFAADYPNPELGGKRSAYSLAVEQVLDVTLPALDGAFAKNIGYETVEDMRARMRARLEESALRQAREAAWDDAIGRLLKNHPVEIPRARVTNYVNHRLKEMGHVHENEDHGHDHSDLEA